jgi:hypothetical protein
VKAEYSFLEYRDLRVEKKDEKIRLRGAWCGKIEVECLRAECTRYMQGRECIILNDSVLLP